MNENISQPGFTINGRSVGLGSPTYIIAEMSANHAQDYSLAVKILHAMMGAGADAVKLQTYTPETLTIDCANEFFVIGQGTLWEGKNLYQLYAEAYTPWEWHEGLKAEAEKLGLDFFSTPFDFTSVDFLEELGVPAYKIASFEIVDIPLIERVAATQKPIIMSTGMASLSEIDDAVRAARNAGCKELALLKCTSAYPAPPEEVNLRRIPHMAEAFGLPAGLSDHTLGIEVPVAAVALGACIIEKHFTLSRDTPGPDSAFSLEPHEFRAMVDAVRVTEKALGRVSYELTEKEQASKVFRRSLFAVRDIEKGEEFTSENVRSIRPGNGLPPKYLHWVLGAVSSQRISRGMPISWEHLFPRGD